MSRILIVDDLVSSREALASRTWKPGSTSGRPAAPLGSETGPLSLCGQVGAHLWLWWFLGCDDLDVRQPEPVGVIAADDGHAVGGQHSSQVGRDDGAAVTQHGECWTAAVTAG